MRGRVSYQICSLGQVRAHLAVLPRTLEVAGVDGRRGEVPRPARVAAVARAPDLAGAGAVGVGGAVAEDFEGVAPVGHVVRALGQRVRWSRSSATAS